MTRKEKRKEEKRRKEKRREEKREEENESNGQSPLPKVKLLRTSNIILSKNITICSKKKIILHNKLLYKLLHQ